LPFKFCDASDFIPKLIFCLALIWTTCFLSIRAALAADPPPNILWVTFEDISPDLGCYGVRESDTPNLDRLASQGVRYTRAWSNAGICAPARATLITGMYPPATGAQNMRSEVLLPKFIRAFPEYLQQAGYYTSNHVKTDYNWIAPDSTWTTRSNDWVNQGWRLREDGQPFFTVINITDTHSSQLYWRGAKNYQRRTLELGPARLHDPAEVIVPPYYPDLPEVRADLARYRDNITFADGIVGDILTQLDEDGLADSTIVFFFGDHGRGMPRSKGWCFHSSLNVPLIIRFPPTFSQLAPFPAGATDDRIVSFVDFAPTALSLAGVKSPAHMHGVPFLGRYEGKARDHAFAYRDRLDERFDLIRSVWNGRWHYIRNYFPHLPWFHQQTRNYPSTQDSYALWHQLEADGRLTDKTAIYMAHSRPPEMLFDTATDPYELKNLADDPAYSDQLVELRTKLHEWQDEIFDLGFMPEAVWIEAFEARGDKSPRFTLAREQDGLYPLQQLRALADKLPAPRHAPHMLAALRSDNSSIQFWGGMGLLANRIDAPEVRAEFRGLLTSDSPTIRTLAAQALASLGERDEALPELLRVLNDEHPLVALRAANALDHLGDASRLALPGIEQYLQSLASTPRDPKLRYCDKFPDWVLRRTVERFNAKKSR
jgi:arylsulfatase A-like enzyme